MLSSSSPAGACVCVRVCSLSLIMSFCSTLITEQKPDLSSAAFSRINKEQHMKAALVDSGGQTTGGNEQIDAGQQDERWQEAKRNHEKQKSGGGGGAWPSCTLAQQHT